MSPERPLSGRIALVTGASRGIGGAIARGLARAGAHVIATARTQGGLEALDDEVFARTGQHATLVPLDIRNGDGIDQLGGQIFARWGRLDIVVSAAGDLGALMPTAHLPPPTFERALAVNLTANVRLIRAMEPLLRRSAAGRAVFLTTGLARRPQPFFNAYGPAKAALENLVSAWAEEVAHTPVRTVLLSPGPMRTRLRAQAFPGEDASALPPPEAIVPLVLDLVRADIEPPAYVEFQPVEDAG